ncbi:MAG: mannitol dehydrogenase [Clostridia bacterium]|nr:mannitol dehydrogenase [Clostridia bacterium]MDR3644357.1 mannitol dehydrogenase [Clostridia bacterium]
MKTFVQYGAGNIGRGFIGAVFSRAGYRVLFIDVIHEVIDTLNQRGRYVVEVVSPTGNREEEITDVAGVDGTDSDAVAQAIAHADLMATAVGVNILPRIVPNITAGLRRRWKEGNNEPLNIIICENLLDADKFLRKLISDSLDAQEKVLFEGKVGLVEASIGRMVPVMTEEMKKGDCLRVCVEPYCQLPVDKAAFRGEIPQVEGLRPFSPFDFFIRRKLFVHNMGHALTAYMGALAGCEAIWQSMQDPTVQLMAQRAMTESARALSKHYGVPLDGILEHVDDLLLRFQNVALGDTVARVGRDLRRKLASSDRLAGAARLCESEGIAPVYICAGLAAALLFDNPGDEGTAFVKVLLAQGGPDAVLGQICGFDAGMKSMEYVREYYAFLKNGGSAAGLFAKCEQAERAMLAEKIVV